MLIAFTQKVLFILRILSTPRGMGRDYVRRINHNVQGDTLCPLRETMSMSWAIDQIAYHELLSEH